MFTAVQDIVVLVLWVLLLAVKGYALFDCFRRPTAAFPAVGRQSKVLWLILCAVAALTGVLPDLTLTLFGIAGTVVALVYLFDVRPRIVQITGPR